MNPELEMALRLLLATALGATIGFQRWWAGKPAGVRTHALVSLGAALFTAVSLQGFGIDAEPSRVASGIVAGIGFIGAGAIIRERTRGDVIVGITTAASIWAVAALGMAAAVGMYVISVVATVLAFVLLLVPTGSKD
ncbi:MAG: MgtC/SapB family protein [Gammaproteobacteria bacterium]|nr:MgtC/SapB family protein [Gammaproteobacteria bacterium]